jgi:hypothetical protein
MIETKVFYTLYMLTANSTMKTIFNDKKGGAETTPAYLCMIISRKQKKPMIHCSLSLRISKNTSHAIETRMKGLKAFLSLLFFFLCENRFFHHNVANHQMLFYIYHVLQYSSFSLLPHKYIE